MALPLTPLRFLERAATVYANKTAVICRDKKFTYGEFAGRCLRLAAALTALGVQRGDRVAYLSFNTHQLLEAYFGVIQAGAILMPLNVRLLASEIAQILNHSEPVALFFEEDLRPLVASLRHQCPSVRHYIALDEVTPERLHYEALLAQQEPAPLDPFAVRDDDIAEIFYTSGSTGMPKGVMLSHRALYLHALGVGNVYVEPATMVDLHTIPLFHANGWGHAHTSTMLGVTQVMVRRFEPALVLKLIEKHRATDMAVVPTMANALLQSPDAATYDLSSMRQIQIGGAAASPSLIERLERLFRCEVYAGYGLTESCPVLTMAREKGEIRYASDSDRWRRRAMTGWPIPGAAVRVVDETMQDVPQDGEAIGEIIASADWLMSGYYRDPEGSNAVLTGPANEPGGVPGQPVWLHTGDMAVWDDQGFVCIVDRKKEIIISGGENISSLEIEAAAYAHESIAECAAIAAPDPQWGEIPVLLVVLKSDHALTAEELLDHLRARLSRFKLPRRIEFLTNPLPKTGTGKIRKMELREPFWADKDKRVQG